MLPLDPHIQDLFVEIPFPSRLLQPLHLVLLEAPAHRSLQLPAGDLLAGLALLRRLDARLKARLHPDPQRRLE